MRVSPTDRRGVGGQLQAAGARGPPRQRSGLDGEGLFRPRKVLRQTIVLLPFCIDVLLRRCLVASAASARSILER